MGIFMTLVHLIPRSFNQYIYSLVGESICHYMRTHGASHGKKSALLGWEQHHNRGAAFQMHTLYFASYLSHGTFEHSIHSMILTNPYNFSNACTSP